MFKIRTNHVRRECLYSHDLTMDELSEFDYLIDTSETDTPEQLQEKWMNSGATFFRYRGELYDLGEFSRVIPHGSRSCHPTECDSPEMAGWHGYMSNSYFSGILIKLVDNYESVIVGAYTS